MHLQVQIAPPTNELLESAPAYLPLLDGIDMTLLDLAAEEIGDVRLTEIAVELANQTFASSQASEESRQLLCKVFELRAARVSAVKSAGRLDWIRSTGTRVRLLDAVERDLLPMRSSWGDIAAGTDEQFVREVLTWAWSLPEVSKELRDAFHLDKAADMQNARQQVSEIVTGWLSGQRFAEIATRSRLDIDDLLGVHTQVVTFALQTAVEQGITLLGKILDSTGNILSEAAAAFPEHFRYGVPTRIGCVLAANGVRHRHAYVLLGQALEGVGTTWVNTLLVRQTALSSLQQYQQQWLDALGELVYSNTVTDLSR